MHEETNNQKHQSDTPSAYFGLVKSGEPDIFLLKPQTSPLLKPK
jgi:hypothetical protein